MPLRDKSAARRAAKAGGAGQATPFCQGALAPAAAAPPAAPPAAAPAPVPAPPQTKSDDRMAELQQLADLHDRGVLTDEEFAAAKAKALGI